MVLLSAICINMPETSVSPASLDDPLEEQVRHKESLFDPFWLHRVIRSLVQLETSRCMSLS